MLARVTMTAVFVLMTTLVAPAQMITDVAPQAASPGDEVVIRGTFANTVTSVRLIATVGGFAGVDTKIVAPISQTPTEVKFIVPTMAGFAPPNATPPGNPLGTVETRDVAGRLSAPFNFFFNQGAYLDPQGTTLNVQSNGLGSTNSLGCRAATTFVVANGPPNTVSGNPNFVLSLEVATPLSPTGLVAGVAAMPPSVAVGDGLVAIDLNQPVTIFPPPPATLFTDGNGDLFLPSPIPAGGPFNVSVTLMFVYVDSISITAQIATGLTINL